jgi:basic amino acid/polyamine antiporter, APA family
MSEEGKLRRMIGLPAAVFVIVGLVIGSSIWLLPTEALAEAGPGMFLGYILAVIPGIFLALICAYVGSAAPTAGGTYVVVSRTLGSFGGALALAVTIAGAGGAVAFMAGTFGIFINHLGVAIPVVISGVAILLAAYVVNILRVEVSTTVAMIITLLGDVLVIILFLIFGLPHVDMANFTPLFPMGFGAVVQASILFIFSYAGFFAVLEIGGEIKNPKKNIPRALGLSLLILATLYTLQAFVVAGTVSWEVAAETIESTGSFTVAQVAEAFTPEFVVRLMPVLILIAIASTIHPMMLAYSRDFMMAGRDRFLPQSLGRINRRFGTPVAGLTVFGACSLMLFLIILALSPALELPLQTAVDLFAAISVSGVLVAEVLLSVAALRLSKKYPDWVASSEFRLSKAVLWIVAVLAIVTAVALLALLAMEEILIMIVLTVLVVPILVYYWIRKAYLAKKGVRLSEIVSEWPADVSAQEL